MSEQHNRDALGRYRQEFFDRQNIAPIDDLMHDDYGVPQSGERIRGNDKAWTVYENYPGTGPDRLQLKARRDLTVVEMILDYDEKGHEGGAIPEEKSPALLAP